MIQRIKLLSLPPAAVKCASPVTAKKIHIWYGSVEGVLYVRDTSISWSPEIQGSWELLQLESSSSLTGQTESHKVAGRSQGIAGRKGVPCFNV